MKTDVLTRPFNQHEIQQRPGPGGKPLSYVSGSTVIARLIEAFPDHDWSFEILRSWDTGNEILVQAQLRVGEVSKCNVGSADSSKPDAMKTAVTDALKRCALLLGIGLHLYGVEPQTNHNETTSETNDRPTERQEVALVNICRFKGRDPEELARELTGRGLKDVNRREMSRLIDSAKAI